MLVQGFGAWHDGLCGDHARDSRLQKFHHSATCDRGNRGVAPAIHRAQHLRHRAPGRPYRGVRAGWPRGRPFRRPRRKFISTCDAIRAPLPARSRRSLPRRCARFTSAIRRSNSTGRCSAPARAAPLTRRLDRAVELSRMGTCRGPSAWRCAEEGRSNRRRADPPPRYPLCANRLSVAAPRMSG